MWIDSEVKALKAQERTYRRAEPINQRGVGRFMIEVLPNGVKSFYFQYFRNSKKILISLGKYKQSATVHGLTLSEAREGANKYSTLLQKGIDPQLFEEEKRIAEQERQREIESAKYRGSFGDLLDSYLESLDGRASYKRLKQSFDCYVKRPFPELLKKYANEIGSAHISLILKKMMQAGITTQVNRTRSQLHAAFSYGIKWDNDPRRYEKEGVLFNLTMNPVSSIPKQADFEGVGDHVIDEKEIKIIWDNMPDHAPLVGYAIKLALATGQRPGELVRLKLTDFNQKERYFTIPSHVSKNRTDHVVPMNDLTLEIVKQIFKLVGDGSEYAFPAIRSGYYCQDKHMDASTVSKHVKSYCENEKKLAKFIPRDIRRTVKTFMGKAGISKELRDRIQNHALTDVSAKHYDRYDYMKEKRHGLVVWNDYLDLIINPKKNVTHIRNSG